MAIVTKDITAVEEVASTLPGQLLPQAHVWRDLCFSWRCAQNCSSIVRLERAGPGVGGGVVFPLSVSVGLALELLLSDVLVGVSLSRLLADGTGLGGGDCKHG